MPLIFKDNTSINVDLPVSILPFKITFFSIANKNAGTTTVNLYVSDGVKNISIVPQDLQLNEGDMLQGNTEQVMEVGNQIKITTDGSIDYFITIDNIPN